MYSFVQTKKTHTFHIQHSTQPPTQPPTKTITIGSCKFMHLVIIFANTFVCTIMTDLLTRFC